MKKIQREKINMRIAVISTTENLDQPTLTVLPFFMAWFLAFKAKMVTFFEFLAQQEALISGAQQNKEALRLDLSNRAVNLAAILRTYATTINNITLYNDMMYLKSTLERLPSVDFIAACNNIAAAANAVVLALIDYNVNSVTMVEFGDKIEEFETANAIPLIKKQAKEAATEAVKVNLTETEVLLKNMDGAIDTLEITNPVLVQNFRRARKIIKLPKNSIAARGTIKTQAGIPLPFVNITCLRLGIKRRSTKLGRFIFKNATEGTYEVIYETPGYEKIIQTMIIVHNVRTEIEVIMVPEEIIVPA